MLYYITLGLAVFALIMFFIVSRGKIVNKEGFSAEYGSNELNQSINGDEDSSALSPGVALSPLSEKLASMPAMSMKDAQENWGKMTSERCYRSDIGESLKLTRNYLQRTNNYVREHPDDCSAPNHEFVGTFYTPFDGVGRNPKSGADYPRSTQTK